MKEDVELFDLWQQNMTSSLGSSLYLGCLDTESDHALIRNDVILSEGGFLDQLSRSEHSYSSSSMNSDGDSVPNSPLSLDMADTDMEKEGLLATLFSKPDTTGVCDGSNIKPERMSPIPSPLEVSHHCSASSSSSLRLTPITSQLEVTTTYPHSSAGASLYMPTNSHFGITATPQPPITSVPALFRRPDSFSLATSSFTSAIGDMTDHTPGVKIEPGIHVTIKEEKSLCPVVTSGPRQSILKQPPTTHSRLVACRSAKTTNEMVTHLSQAQRQPNKKIMLQTNGMQGISMDTHVIRKPGQTSVLVSSHSAMATSSLTSMASTASISTSSTTISPPTSSPTISSQPRGASGLIFLTEEEKRTLVSEGYPIPTKLPLSKAEERSLKKIRRKIKNKISAQESRRKKKEYMDNLERKYQQLLTQTNEWKVMAQKLQAENECLVKKLAQLECNLQNSGGLQSPLDPKLSPSRLDDRLRQSSPLTGKLPISEDDLSSADLAYFVPLSAACNNIVDSLEGVVDTEMTGNCLELDVD